MKQQTKILTTGAKRPGEKRPLDALVIGDNFESIRILRDIEK